MQWKAAQDGNTAMLIWLGKQELGQREPDKLQPQAIQADYQVEEIQAAALAQVADFLQQAADQGRSIEEVIGRRFVLPRAGVRPRRRNHRERS